MKKEIFDFSEALKLIRKGKAHIENNKLVVHDDVECVDFEAIRAELGDCFWQLNGICSVLGYNVNSICRENLHLERIEAR